MTICTLWGSRGSDRGSWYHSLLPRCMTMMMVVGLVVPLILHPCPCHPHLAISTFFKHRPCSAIRLSDCFASHPHLATLNDRFLSLEQEDGGSSTHEVLSLSADGEEGLTSSLPAAGGGISGTGSGGVLSAGGLGSGSLEGQQSFSNSNGTGNGSGSGSQRGVQAAWAAATQALLSDAAAQHGVYTDSGVPPVLRQHSAAVQAS
jgi:hypothetical protein